MSSGRRIGLVGSINRDTIRTCDGIETESYGGLLYTIVPLAEIVSLDTVILPVYDVGEDVERAVRRILRGYRSVSLEELRFGPEPNPHCFIEYDANGGKQETLLETGRPLPPERLKPCSNADALLVNFITGFELELATLQGFRQGSSAVIFVDIHSLTLGIDSNRRRFWQRPDDWAKWTACVDVVQMNEHEAALLADRRLDKDSERLSFAEKVLETGPSCVVMTRGDKGSVAWFRENGRTIADEAPANPDGDPVDPTGCGDAFLAGFCWRYLETGDARAANRFGNQVAGIACSVRGIEGLREIRKRLKKSKIDHRP